MAQHHIPSVTRAYTTACFLTTAAVQMELVSPFQIYFNPDLIFKRLQVFAADFTPYNAEAEICDKSSELLHLNLHDVLWILARYTADFPLKIWVSSSASQIWRLVTNFLYFGELSFSFLFNMVFTYRYCKMLEETSFRGRTADFVFMFLFGGLIITAFGLFVNLSFLGQAFTLMLVYVWCRRNPFVRINILGLVTVQAPYLPWVFICFSVLVGDSILVDALGIAAGHIYFFLEDVFPNQPGGKKLLVTPAILKQLFDDPPSDPNYNPLPEDIRNQWDTDQRPQDD